MISHGQRIQITALQCQDQAAGFDDAEAAWKAFDGKTEETQSGDNTTAPTNGN